MALQCPLAVKTETTGRAQDVVEGVKEENKMNVEGCRCTVDGRSARSARRGVTDVEEGADT